jgi:hypothetical protein
MSEQPSEPLDLKVRESTLLSVDTKPDVLGGRDDASADFFVFATDPSAGLDLISELEAVIKSPRCSLEIHRKLASVGLDLLARLQSIGNSSNDTS